MALKSPRMMDKCCCKDELWGVIEADAELVGTIDSPAALVGELSISKVIYANDHNRLRNRDMDDQHPISAITGLQDALDSKVDENGFYIIYCGTSTEVIE